MFQFNRFLSLFKFKTSRQLIFSIAAGFMVVFVFGVIIFCSIFLVSHLRGAFGDVEPHPAQQAPSFDIIGFEKLHL